MFRSCAPRCIADTDRLEMLNIRKILLLRKLPLFQHMSPDALSALAKIANDRIFAKGEVVFVKGEEGKSLFIIVEGAVQIHEHTNSSEPHRELATLGEGEFFGELSILDNESRSASATAVADSILLEIGQNPFQKLLVENFELSQNLLAALANRVRNLSKKIQNNI